MYSLLLFGLFACDLDFFGGGSAPAEKNEKNINVKKGSLRSKLARDDEYRQYEASGKRDPFRSFLSTTQVEVVDENMAKDPKRRYEVRQYALTGIMWDMEPPVALVEDPEGIGHVVEIGEYLGNKWGKVREIKDNTVIIVEEIKTTDGEIVPKPILLTLRANNVEPY
jgi:Tfp pilus assembly protein PilP